MNRIDRITAILIQLQSKKIVKSQDIAERFKICLRTVYRDIKTLEEAGVPILGEPGVGYSLMEGYRLPPVMFSREEATAFLTAEKIMEKFSDPSTNESYKSAMFKVKAVLRSSEKDLLENMDDHIAVFRSNIPFNNSSVTNTLQSVLKSIEDRKQLRIQYSTFHSNEITDRNIEPVGIFYAGGYWHAIAFCRLRNDYRDFRTDRVLKITKTDEPFYKSHPSLKTYLTQIALQKDLEKVVINVKKETARYLQEAKYYYGFVSETQLKDSIQMSFLTSSLDQFLRWYMMFADEADVVQPASLLFMLKEHVSKVAKRIS